MRVRRNGLVLLGVLGFVVTSIGVMPAGAKIPRITGGVRCTISNGSMTFNPGLRDRNHISGERAHGPSATSFSADLSSCTDPSNGPAPASIDHGTLQGNGKVGGSFCENVDRLKLTTTATWRKADNTVVGTTVVKLAVDVTIPETAAPWTLSFAGPAKAASTVFPHDPISFALETTSPKFIYIQCFKLTLDGFTFANGTFAADPPA